MCEMDDRFEAIYKRPLQLEIEGLDMVYPGNRSRRKKELAKASLKEISLKVHRREFVAVVGPSGCGKSSLLRTVAGLEDASAGSIRVDGKTVRGPGPDRGMVFQNYSLFPWSTVVRNVMFPLRMAGVPGSLAEAEAKTWVKLVGLGPYADYYPAQLSGGMKQRVAIARALAGKPRVLLMDEPFGALDAQTRGTMQAYLLEIWRNVDVTILFVTHDLDEALLLADRVVVMNSGSIQEILEVRLPVPRGPEIVVNPDFIAVKAHIEELIRKDHSLEREEGFSMLRMTRDGDEVP